MSAPIAQLDIERELLRLSELLEEETHEIAQRAVASAEADAAYKSAHARAFLTHDGSVAQREALAAGETEDEYLARKIADAHLLASQEAGRNYRAQLEALRTLAANQRALVVGS